MSVKKNMSKYTLLSGSHSNINQLNYIDIKVRSTQFNQKRKIFSLPLQFLVTHSEVAGLGLDLKKSAWFCHSWATPLKSVPP